MDRASSSSSATEPDTVAGLLARSFVVLAEELPAAWERFCLPLSGRAVEIHVDGERFTVLFGAGGAAVGAPLPTCDARIETSRTAIADVLGARLSLRDAVMASALQVTAPLGVLDQLHQGILAYVHGGVRCPSFPLLLKRFLALPAPVAPEPGRP